MKTAKYLSLAAIALMGTLASCQSDDEAASIASRPANAVGMNITVGSMLTTRSNAAATDDSQKQFNEGDQVSVSATNQDAVIYQLQSDGSTWTETVANKWLLWTADMLTFDAYYPVTTGTDMTNFTLPTDQSTSDNIALADYMTKSSTISRPSGGSDISMELERKMARVIIRIADFGDQYDYASTSETVSNVKIYSAASAIEDGSAVGAATAVTPYEQGNGTVGSTYTALVIPATGNSSATFVTLTDGESQTLQVTGIPEMEAGKSYTFDLTVGKNAIRVSNVTVVDWTTGTTLTGGQATEGSATTLVTGITLNKTSTTIAKGSTETLSVSSVTPDDATDKTVTWSSDNESVATVDATTGVVTAVAMGTANITATAHDGSGVSATCAVTVNTVVTFNSSDITSLPYTKDGVTMTYSGARDFDDKNFFSGSGTFTSSVGNFTRIVVNAGMSFTGGAGWSGSTWTGNAASVTYSEIWGGPAKYFYVTFTIGPAE